MGKIYLITAPSGAGKTTVMNKLKESFPQDYLGECISTTTRKMRDGEEDGVTYYFTDELTFDDLAVNNKLAERVVYDGNLYGITKDEIQRVLSNNKHVYIIVEYEGYKQIKAQYPDAVGIFLYMSKEDCLANMLMRGDSMDKAMKRIEKYDDEMKNRVHYDYVVKNVRDSMYQTMRIIGEIIVQNQ